MNLTDLWTEYSQSTPSKAKNHIEPRYRSFYLNTIPPKSSLIRSIRQIGTIEFDDFGLIELQINDFKTWIAAKRLSNKWFLTMDELPLLLTKTKGWKKYEVGYITYYSKEGLNSEEKNKANLFLNDVKKLEKTLGISVPNVSYFVSHDKSDSLSIVGEVNDGAGKGRYRVIKAVNRVDHLHEMVHVLAMEIGLINPFFDEGLATALEKGSRIKNDKECEDLKNIVGRWSDFLDGSTFNSAHMSNQVNVYGLAQITMRYWISKFGINSVKKVISETIDRPDTFKRNIEKFFEPISNTTHAIRSELNKVCSRET